MEKHNIENLVKNISKEVNKLNTDSIIKNIPDTNEILLLGECTHGTCEFYQYRSKITKKLILNGYRVIFIEAEWPDIYRVNQYILGKNNDKNANESLNNINKFPKWMWRNNIMIELIEWLYNFNKNNNNPVYIFGIDCQQIYKSYNDLLSFLKKNDIYFHMYIIRLLSFLKKFNNESEYSQAISDGTLKNYIDTIPQILQELLSKYQWENTEEYLKNNNIDPIDIISSEQNIEILVNSEEYFRKMVLEPPGSQASWNTRDQHMLMTIMRIRNRFQQISKENIIPKVIVWAHNSHIGNSNATNRGGNDFNNNNTWNLGQMVVETFPNNFAIGFYTSHGEVTANSHNSNIPSTIYKLNEPYIFSYEWFFTHVSKYLNLDCFYIDLTKYKNDTSCINMSNILSNQQLNIEYFTLYCNNKITINENIDSSIIKIVDKEFIFKPISRTFTNHGIARLKLESGGWITEYYPNMHIDLYCRPCNFTFSDDTTYFFNNNNLQRWIGITYCKETEINSHYANSCLAKQYDMIIYIDKTTGIYSIDK